MIRATWKGHVLAESEYTEMVEGNHYFPPQSLHREYLRESSTKTFCGWKGDCSYYDVLVDGQINADAAWYYPNPFTRAEHIKGHVAFWKGVQIQQQ